MIIPAEYSKITNAKTARVPTTIITVAICLRRYDEAKNELDMYTCMDRSIYPVVFYLHFVSPEVMHR